MASTPQFFSAWKCSGIAIGTADTSRTGPTNYGTVMTAGSNGSRVLAVRITGTASNSAEVVRLFKHSGSTWRMVKEIAVAATTASSTAATYTQSFAFPDNDPLILINGETLRATCHNGDDFIVEAEYGDY